MRSWSRWVFLVSGALFVAACSSGDSADDEIAADTCGPQGTAEEAGGCRCDAGFTEVDGRCVEDDGEDEPGMLTPPPEIVRLLPAACFVGPSPCEPRTGEGCAEGESCSLTPEGRLICRPPPRTAAIGDACDSLAGPFCEAGAWCVGDASAGTGICRAVCCGDGECSEPGHRCVGVFQQPALGSLGACFESTEPSPMCLSAGATCTVGNDQCCGFCHIDHCH
ncbi:MAG: hypothetical protein AAGA56_20535 [Myxococcota bacterium]